MKFSLVSLFFSAATIVSANQFHQLGRLIPPKPSSQSESALTTAKRADITGSGFFTQLLDHDDPSKGTFQQKFWWSSEFWEGPGSPVVFLTPGEIAAEGYVGYLTNETITGVFAQEIKGAVVMVEHRYWGDSSPYSSLDAESLQYLTLKQAIADFVRIAKTIDLPFDTNHSSNADKAPWVWSGGSYAGALAAWIESTSPGTFWAYHASSAPVEAIKDYWQYFVPVQNGMAKNCSSDVTLVIDYVDKILLNGSASEKLALKTKFGLQDLKHDADFASTLQNGPWLWQSNDFTTGYSGFFEFCDAVENVEAGAAVTPGAKGVGLEKALAGYANWVNNTLIPGFCQNYGYTDERELACMDTYDPSNFQYTIRTVENDIDLQWNWMLCNEPFAYWQDGAPTDRSTIVSRLVNAAYWQRQCALFFPTVNGYTYGSANTGETVNQVNAFTKGWNLNNTTRLIWTNGEFDPWRTAGMSSEFRPGGPLASTTQHPLQIIPGGFHCSDLIMDNAAVNEGVQNVVDNEVKQIVEWVNEFPRTY